jgi:bifunctional DNA-binding transcriptional regulator/antitoxin component of YhaV-PrlF toxin-antitoxin module
MIRWMPVLRLHHGRKPRHQPVDQRDDFVAARHRQRAPWAEITLNIGHDQRLHGNIIPCPAAVKTFAIRVILVYILPSLDRSKHRMKSRNIAKLSSKFQISIPQSVREKEKWEAGQEFAFIPSEGGMLLVPVPKFEDLIGIAKGANTENYRDRDDRY